MSVINGFLNTIGDETKSPWVAFVHSIFGPAERKEDMARAQISAFMKGLDRGRKPILDVSDSVPDS